LHPAACIAHQFNVSLYHDAFARTIIVQIHDFDNHDNNGNPVTENRYRHLKNKLARILGFVLIVLSAPLVATASETSIDGKLLTGTKLPSGWKLPDNVIDTTTLPQFSLDAKARDTAILPVYQLTRDTFFLFGNIATLDEKNRGWNGNAGFVITGEGVVAIDTLGTPKLGRRMIATIRQLTDQPIKYLIVTHNHPDHAYGAGAFQALDGITVIAHQGTKAYNNSSTLEQSVAYREEILPTDMKGFKAVDADIYVDGNRFSSQTIRLGNKSFNIYNTGRHHSYGDLVIHQQPDNIVWISDLAFNLRTTYMGDGNSKQILEAQQWLMDKFSDARLMVPGHGGPQSQPFPMVEKTRNYVEKLRREMLQAVENGVSLYDAVQNTEFAQWKDTRLYEENHRANANFVYREMEQEYFDNF
jgi:glyoxylase-like metal-dependent hydrolase (beta-lactamase superfamily II)